MKWFIVLALSCLTLSVLASPILKDTETQTTDAASVAKQLETGELIHKYSVRNVSDLFRQNQIFREELFWRWDC